MVRRRGRGIDECEHGAKANDVPRSRVQVDAKVPRGKLPRRRRVGQVGWTTLLRPEDPRGRTRKLWGDCEAKPHQGRLTFHIHLSADVDSPGWLNPSIKVRSCCPLESIRSCDQCWACIEEMRRVRLYDCRIGTIPPRSDSLKHRFTFFVVIIAFAFRDQ